MRNKSCKVGLDIGSTTAKIVVIDGQDKPIFSRYKRHNARVGQLISSYFNEIIDKFGDLEVNLCVTGSVGMSTAEQLKAEFIQEVVAATAFANTRYPEAKALIDIGGEDAKVVFFNDGNAELRMNGNCAGGTGAFLDQMSVLMGIDNNTMSNLAMQAERTYPMAARCGVFAKTDIQNLMSRNLPESDIAASIFHSIAVQTVTTLSHGCDFQPPILLCGGPLTFLPALRKAFAHYLKLGESDFIVIPESNLIPALGCAIRGKGDTVKISELQKRLATQEKQVWHSDLQPLFKDEIEHEKWLERKNAFATEIHPLRKGPMQVVLGIDSGSTTTKVIALDTESSDIVFSFYTLNLGNPIKAVREGLERLRSEAAMMNCDLRITGACSTGYGEELIKAAFNLDEGIIETIAHYQAAESLMPDVSFILDIGGQDMKAIFVENGAVVRMELNEACSSGCGTFIQTFANNLNYEVQNFAKIACTASAPCDLGTRCTVFMNSKVKQVLREGATVADISAGLSYSVVKNCLYKVLKLRGNDSLGDNIVVQGGTMRNDSVVRAFELLTGTEVARNNMPEMMGAYGCALHLKAGLDAAATTNTRTLDQLLAGAEYETRMLQCRGCENHCFVSMYQFQGGRKFYSGNKCERVFNNKGDHARKGENIYTYKYQRLFREPGIKPKEGSRRIGIPRVLNMYEDYPFWSTLLRKAGFDTVLSAESTFTRYEGALGSVMSDNICFPAKLVHSHIHELENLGVERILMPYVVYEHNEDARTLNSYNCPIVSAYSDVVRSAMEPKVPVDSPVINFSNLKLLTKQIEKYLHGIGVSKKKASLALHAALEAQRSYIHDIKAENAVILRKSREEGKLTILLAGRPYHTDPLIQHKLSEMVASLGVNVISDDIVRGDDSVDSGETYLVKQWAYMNRIIKSGQWAAGQPDNLHFVQMTSFGCGPDAFIQDEIRDILKRHGKPFTLLKIDDVSNIGSLKLRVRSLIESLKAKNDDYQHRTRQFETTRVFRQADTRRKILAPYMTAYLTPLLSPLLDLMGYDVEVLPMSDDESAQLGLTYANNEICYPATLIVGDIVKALKSGKYDLKNTAIVMTQTGGQCRATSYAGLIKRAMIANGFKDVPLITLGVAANAEGGNEQEGFAIPWMKFANIITTSILYGDTISKMYHAAAVRERKPGVAVLLRDKFMREADPLIRRNDANGLLKIIGNAAAEFDAVCVNKDTQKVGIVGEIFLKFNPFSHQFLADKIISRGIEVVPPLLSPFFLQEFVNVIAQKHLGLSCSRVPDFVVKGIYGLILRREKKINRIAARFRYFRPFTNIFDEAKAVNGTVSLAAQFGEGWLLPADIISLIHGGVNNIVSLQPFGCIANHVVSKGIEKRLHRDYPQLNLVSLDFDSGVSAVNVTNRLLLFLDNIAV
ncbi:2-hydroxyglutaryl-CoA dehydratase [Prevotella sp. oral taxon 376]|uniref:acyl-CoA dehydratase activase-related protein n=1 Tax=Prevotella sp. oral taxon 376 TaxID=712466 RepID=UPI000D1FB85A|nr:acyl-CoA dehydratase activase-related protein [Prevotella sp. oral taxon 376]PTL33253.1 2-hydroxyglutaryl-CoA dehydratase [Prevotella sp. oral taxon 376]